VLWDYRLSIVPIIKFTLNGQNAFSNGGGKILPAGAARHIAQRSSVHYSAHFLPCAWPSDQTFSSPASLEN
jgi:hypothetical protein